MTCGPGNRTTAAFAFVFATRQAQKNGRGRLRVKSDELVFTVAKGSPAPAGLRPDIPVDTRLRSNRSN